MIHYCRKKGSVKCEQFIPIDQVMARTVVSVIQNQQAPKTKRAKESPSKPSPVTTSYSSTKGSINRLPPKKRAKVAKKLKVQEKVTNLNSQVQSPGPAAKTTEVKKKTSKNPGGVKAKYLSLISECIVKLKSRSGSSRAAILNQLKLDHSKAIGVNEANINLNLKLALKFGLDTGVLRMAKDTGKGSGSFKLTDEEIKRRRASRKESSNNQTLMNSFISDNKCDRSELSCDESLSETEVEEDISKPRRLSESFVMIEKVPEETLMSSSSPSLRRSIRAKRARSGV